MEGEPQKSKAFIYLIIILALGVVAVNMYFSRLQKVTGPRIEQPRSSLLIQTKDSKTRFARGETITVYVVADSAGSEIVGLDALIGFDPEVFTFVKATSLLPEFTLASFPQKNFVSLTFTKSPQSTTSSIFARTQVAELTFTAKKTGDYPISILSTVEKEQTKLVTDQTQVLQPNVSDLIIEIY